MTEVYAAASRARRSGRDTIGRLAACADRIEVAARTIAPRAAGPSLQAQSGVDAITAAANCRLHAIEHADRRLADALDALDAAKVAVGDADRGLRQFHPYGGTLVTTPPMRNHAVNRLELAAAAAGTRYRCADNATYALVKQVVAGERAVRAVEFLISYLLDHGLPAAIAPPPFLRLVRAALPAGQQLDWWRELCSLFAECHADERRTQATSQGLNALRTIWTAWTTARESSAAPRAEEAPLTSTQQGRGNSPHR